MKKKQDKLKPEKQTVVTLRDVRIVKETLMNSDHPHNETYIIELFAMENYLSLKL